MIQLLVQVMGKLSSEQMVLLSYNESSGCQPKRGHCCLHFFLSPFHTSDIMTSCRYHTFRIISPFCSEFTHQLPVGFQRKWSVALGVDVCFIASIDTFLNKRSCGHWNQTLLCPCNMMLSQLTYLLIMRQWIGSGTDNGLAPNRGQVII